MGTQQSKVVTVFRGEESRIELFVHPHKNYNVLVVTDLVTKMDNYEIIADGGTPLPDHITLTLHDDDAGTLARHLMRGAFKVAV